MALFDHTLINEVCTRVTQHHASLSKALGRAERPDVEGGAAQNAPLRQHLALLVSIANGERMRVEATKADVKAVETSLTQVQEILFGNAMQARTIFPDAFWQTDIGILFSRVRWWLSADELITISNAAAIAFGENSQANRMRIVRAMDGGLLDWIPDPSVANRQQNRRVLRPQVERLGEQRRRPE